MRRLRPDKLDVQFVNGTTRQGPVVGRRYTLTHSDATGDLFLTVGPDYDREQISGWYTRLLRDEVLAEWREDADGLALHVHCHVSGGLVLGGAGWRYQIFRRELPLVLEAIRYGDREVTVQGVATQELYPIARASPGSKDGALRPQFAASQAAAR